MINRFEDDPARCDEQEQGFKKYGEILHFTMAELVAFIGRLVGDAPGGVGHGGSDHVQSGVGSLGEDAKGVGQQADDELDGGESCSDQDGEQGDGAFFFFARGVALRGRLSARKNAAGIKRMNVTKLNDI